MGFRVGLLALSLASAPMPLLSQDTLTVADTLPGRALNLGAGHFGLSLGNSPRWNGIRINFRDRAVREVNGLNVTLWNPGKNRFAVYRGVSVGLGPYGASLMGLNVGVAGLVAERALYGVNLAGLGTVSQGNMVGLNVAGLGTVAEGDMAGINLSGLGTVAQGRMRGFNFGGLATVAERGVTGLNIGGLAVVGEHGGVRGISVAGLAVVGEEGVKGVSVAGLAVVGDESVQGLTVTLGAIESGSLVRGWSVAGYRIKSPQVQGVAIPVAWLRTEALEGASISVYNRVVGTQRGLAIGLLNYARELHGVQLGVLNIAGNNRGVAHVLPVINLHR